MRLPMWSWTGVVFLALGACTGSDEQTAAAVLRSEQAAQDAQDAATPVDLQRLPALYQCLGALSQQLKSALGPDAVSLVCLVGSYRGQTAQGDACALQVDAGLRRFTFSFGSRTAEIDWEAVGQGADGRPVFNLEASDLDVQRPGVQLTRFTAVPEAVTETLALRAGLPTAGAQGLPQISYLRVQDGKAETVACRYAT